jgi:hypothetical protein
VGYSRRKKEERGRRKEEGEEEKGTGGEREARGQGQAASQDLSPRCILMASQAAEVRKQTEAFFNTISKGAHDHFLLLFAEEVEVSLPLRIPFLELSPPDCLTCLSAPLTVQYEDATVPEGVIKGMPRVREHLEAVAKEWHRSALSLLSKAAKKTNKPAFPHRRLRCPFSSASIVIYWGEGAILVEGLSSFSMVEYSLADTEHRRFICRAFFQLTFDEKMAITRIKSDPAFYFILFYFTLFLFYLFHISSPSII